MVWYSGVNEQKIYNLKIKKIYLLSSVWFDKGFCYYNTSDEVTDEDENVDKLGDIQNKANNKKFSKVMTGKQIEKKGTFIYPTPQLQKDCIAANSKEKRDNNSFFESVIDNNHFLSHQPMLSLTVINKISSSLTNISKANTSLLPKTFQDPNVDLLKSSITDQLKSSHQFRLKSGVIKRIDYNNPRKLGKTMSILEF